MVSTPKLKNNQKKRKNGLVIEADIGWTGSKPADTKAQKIHQIKTEFIDERALLIVGAEASDFEGYPHILADVSIQHLIQYVELLGKMKDHKSFLIIEGLDTVSKTEQEKFIPLLKDRQILSSKLPDKIQILIPIKEVEPVSKKVQSLIFPLKV